MFDLGRAARYFSTSLECIPSTLKARTYLYGAGAGAGALEMVWMEVAKTAAESRDHILKSRSL